MGEILAFSPKPAGSDWSANERGLLTLLTQQLSNSYGLIDVVFGQTDSGDPWYVVMDANQDVIVHIARIDGQFVVHDAAVDMFHQVGSLWGALRHVLSTGADQQGGVVVAFNPASREAQSFLSLVIAVGLFLEMRGLEFGENGRLDFESMPRADDPSIEGMVGRLVAALDLAAAQARGEGHVPTEGGHGAAAGGNIKAEGLETIEVEGAPEGQSALPGFEISHIEQPAAPKASAMHRAQAGSEPPSVAPPTTGAGDGVTDSAESGGGGFTAKAVMRGTVNDDRMFGTPFGDVIRAGDGDDYVDGKGARGGELDMIDGGAGDDKIVMNARVVAIGGAGGDTFLLSAETPKSNTEALLGVVLDYSGASGDRFALVGEGQATVVSTAVVNDVLATQEFVLGEMLASETSDITQPVAGVRVGFDFDGDNREDAFLLVAGAGAMAIKIGTTITADVLVSATNVSVIGPPPTDGGLAGDSSLR